MEYIEMMEQMKVGMYLSKPVQYLAGLCVAIVIAYACVGIIDAWRGIYHEASNEILPDIIQFAGYFAFLVLSYAVIIKGEFFLKEMSVFNYFTILFCSMEAARFFGKSFVPDGIGKDKDKK